MTAARSAPSAIRTPIYARPLLDTVRGHAVETHGRQCPSVS